MKTYKKEVEKPMLVIEPEYVISSPRENLTLGKLITISSRMCSPDTDSILETIVKETSNIATDEVNHMELIKERFDKEISGDRIIKIYPVTVYKHSQVVYKLGHYSGFDYSNNSFYIITNMSAKELAVMNEDNFETVIKDELTLYNQYINREVYRFTLFDKKGNIELEVSEIYGLDAIKTWLPSKWEDENLMEYIV